MPKLTYSALLLTVLLSAGCSNDKKQATDQPSVSEDPVTSGSASAPTGNVKQIEVETVKIDDIPENRFDGWAGKWIGPEGMYVDVKPLGKGQFLLKMQSDLDTKGTYTGSAEEHGIRFTRNGEALRLYRTNGNETGLKYLAGKKECLMVKSGEGYCRD
jgi:hypothetical protein